MTCANIYTDGNLWYYAAWIDGEYDSNGICDDCDTEEQATAWVAEQFGIADIRVVEYAE